MLTIRGPRSPIPDPATRSRRCWWRATSPRPGLLPPPERQSCTASPPISRPITSISPVCTPARISSPGSATALAIARARRIAQPGRANVARSRLQRCRLPATEPAARVTCSWCSSRRIAPSSVPEPNQHRRRVHDVGEQRRRRARSGSAGSRVPVRNSWISTAISSPPTGFIQAAWSSPASSRSVTSGRVAAR